jgi:predicted transcriptional regulator of viral defense system
MNIYELRQQIGREVIDYNTLMSVLGHYSQPRKKISLWLKSGDLISVKKGLYIFGPKASQEPASLEVLANLIYGPSAISLHYALNYYGLIPERVHTVTSITNKRNKQFTTPLGEFTYHYLTSEKYAIGIDLLETANKTHFLIATPEKALCDLIALEIKNISFYSERDVEHFLFDDVRIDDMELRKLDKNQMIEIADIYRNVRLKQFITHYLKWIQHNA